MEVPPDHGRRRSSGAPVGRHRASGRPALLVRDPVARGVRGAERLARLGEPDRCGGGGVLFVGAVGAYIIHGALRNTKNQFEHPTRGSHVAMVLLIVGEIGGFGVLLAGFVAGQLLR
jgi:hypothetical protein